MIASCLTITRRCCHVTVRVPHLLLRVLLDPPDQAGDPGVDPGVVRAGAPLPVAHDAQLGVPGSVFMFVCQIFCVGVSFGSIINN